MRDNTRLLCFLLPFILLGLWTQTKYIESYRLQQPLEVNATAHSIEIYPIEIIQGNHSLTEKDEREHNVSIVNKGVPKIISSNLAASSSEDSLVTVKVPKERKRKRKSKPKKSKLLTCEEIQNLEIVRQIGKGNRKTVFEVKLPTGVNAIAKRLHRNAKASSKNSYKWLGLAKKETHYLEKLQDIFGKDDTLGFFGECQATSQSVFEKLQKDGVENDALMRNFSIGYTAVLEMGTPLIPEAALMIPKNKTHACHQDARKCFGNYFTESDVADLTKIARQYSNYDGKKRLLMKGRTREISDNCKPEQFVTTDKGLRHIDLGMVFDCKRLDEGCSYEEALEINCSMIRLLVNNPNLDCRETPKEQLRREKRINTTEALEECSALFPTTEKEKEEE